MCFAVDFTPGGFPIGVRVERLENGDLRFLEGDRNEHTPDADQQLSVSSPRLRPPSLTCRTVERNSAFGSTSRHPATRASDEPLPVPVTAIATARRRDERPARLDRFREHPGMGSVLEQDPHVAQLLSARVAAPMERVAGGLE